MRSLRVSALPCAAASLRPPPVELDLVHCPHGALHVLHPHEALVEREIVANCVLKIRDSDDFDHFKCIAGVSVVQVPGTSKTFFIVAKVR